MLGLALLALPLAACGEDYLVEIEIAPEEEAYGQKDYTVRLLPGKTHRCKVITFGCVLQQKFPWEDTRGRKYIKVHEPMTYVYRERDVKLVHDLDRYISFRAPIGLDRLKRMYGEKTFNPDHPVVVSRIKMTATGEDGAELWSYELEPKGTYSMADLAAGKKGADEDDIEDLDGPEPDARNPK